MYKKLIYNGKSSDELGLVIQATPTYEYPSRDVTTTHVPGRNGDVITDNGGYNNVNRTYSLAKGYVKGYGGVEHTPPNARAVLNWLNSSHGRYVRLEDEYDPDVYRLATYNSNGSFGDLFDQALTLDVSFNCKPQRYLKYGEKPLGPFHNGVAEIRNPYNFVAKPKIKIENLPTGKITMMEIKNCDGDITSLISLNNINEVEIDSETLEVSDPSSIGLNGKGFPRFEADVNNIEINNYTNVDDTAGEYNTILNQKQDIVNSEYMPYESIIASYEETFKVPSWNSIISEAATTYQSSSYQTFISDLCADGGKSKTEAGTKITITGEFVIPSANEMPLTRSQTFQVSDGDIEDFESDFVNKSGKDIKAKYNGYYRCSKGKNWFIRKNANDVIYTIGKNDTTFDIIYLPVTSNWELQGVVEMIKDMPPWITITSAFSNDKLKAIIYKMNQNGFLWKDKTGTFSKAGWSHKNIGDAIVTYNWSSLSNEFISDASSTGALKSLLSSSDKTFTWKYLKDDEFPQYEDTTLFEVIPLTGTFEHMKLKLIKTGWYRISIGDNTNWVYSNGTYEMNNVPTTAGFSVSYLKNIPTYRNVSKFPSWIDDIPYQKNGNVYSQADLNTEDMVLKLKPSVNENLYTTENVSLNEFIEDDGTESPDPNCAISDYIAVSPSTKYTITFKYKRLGYMTSVHGYDTDKNWTSKLWKQTEGAEDEVISYSFETAEDDHYVKISFPKINENITLINNTNDVSEGWYRVHLTNADGEEIIKDWVHVTSENPWTDDLGDEYEFTNEQSITIGYMSKDPSSFPKYYNDADRSFSGFKEPPGWLTYELSMQISLDADDAYYPTCYRDVTHDVVWDDDGDTPGHKRLDEPYYCWKYTDRNNVVQYFFTKFNMCPSIGDKIYKASSSYEPVDETIGTVYQDAKITYQAAQSGIFCMDNSKVWVGYNVGATILTTGYMDTTFFRYLEELPEYKTYEDFGFTIPEWLEPVSPESTEGNPTQIKMKIAQGYDGYYRVNSNINWQWFEAGDELCSALINEVTTIHKLDKIDGTVSADITVTPNWWIL